jgi:predicted metal-dependent HD superfamily phosphohydrolase
LDVLSGSRPRYAAYVAAVRAEYAHAPEAAWRSGRAQVLAALLTRPRLYLLAGSKAERKARVNLAGELATLR